MNHGSHENDENDDNTDYHYKNDTNDDTDENDHDDTDEHKKTKDNREPLHHHHQTQYRSIPPFNPFVSRLQHPYASAKSMMMIMMTSRRDPSKQSQLLPLIHSHPLLLQRRKEHQQKLQQSQQSQLKTNQQQEQQERRKANPSDWQEINALEDYLMSILQQLHQLQRRLIKMGLFDLPIWTLLLPCLLLALLLITPYYFQWHPLTHRQLKGRTCVMNLFVDKMEPNEFHLNLGSHHHNKNHNHPRTAMDITPASSISTLTSSYRTQEQIDTMSRFIGCVADSFRSHIHVEQAIVFAHVRDGGQLAQEALLHWPHRGEYSTQLHVMVATDAATSGTTNNKMTSLDNTRHDDNQYDLTVQELKQRFQHSGDTIHLYDGNRNTIDVQDDEVDTDDDEQQPPLVQVSQDRHRRRLSTVETPPSLISLLIPDADDPPIIPYFHIDGKWKEQLVLLQQVKPLLEDHTIVVITMEHAPDINITEMVQFYSDLNYKTFMLGMRQLTRIDNLCPEVLENALEHPNMATTSHETNLLSFHHSSKGAFVPPFFVAMPKGRHAKEEMTIQHMYDLFSGFGGGGQVKTANDRKAPTKR